MSKLNHIFQTTRLSIWLLVCVLILTATSVYAAGNPRPLAAVDILGSPDAAVDGQFAVGTTTPGNKALTVAGVIDFVGAGTVHNYFTQGPGNNMQIRSNVDEYNAVGNSSYTQWNMVMGASLDVFSIRRSPAGSTYDEDALFWINGNTGRVGIATVDTSNGATIPFTLQARLHVQSASGTAIYGVSDGVGVFGYSSSTSGGRGVWGEIDSWNGSGVYGYNTATIGGAYGVYGRTESTNGMGVYGLASASSGTASGVYGYSNSSNGRGVYGTNHSTSGNAIGVFGMSESTEGHGVYGSASASSGTTYGVYGKSDSTGGIGIYSWASASSGATYGLYSRNDSTAGRGVYGWANANSGTNYGVYGQSDSPSGYGVFGNAITGSGVNSGVWGQSASPDGRGVYGYASATSGTNTAVRASSASSSGFDFYAAGYGTDYGPFTGAHEVQLSESFPAEIRAGMIVSGVGEAHIRETPDGDVDISSTLPTVRLTDQVEDKAVLGVLVAEIELTEDHWYSPAAGERFASVNALGEGRVWVTNINGGIEAGDAITSSEIPGYGQRQDDDLLHIYTLGKAMETVDWDTVTETVTFNGQEYKVYLLAVVYTSG